MERDELGLKRLVLDVMKLHQPSLVEFAERLASIPSVDGVNCILREVDQNTETLKVIIVGENINYALVERMIEDMGGTIQSVDAVVAGRRLVEDVAVPSD